MKIVPLLLALAAALPATAADVDVRFTAPERYRDAGRTTLDRERSTGAVADVFKALAATLPAGQTLRVDVTDIDLAGEPKVTNQGEVRVMRGRADWPRIDFKWALEAQGRVLRQGTESIADLQYDRRPAPRGNDVLPYETRLLEQWFAQQFDTPKP